MLKHYLFLDYSNARGSRAIELLENNENIEFRTVAFHPLTGTKISQESIDWASKIFVFNEKDEKLKTQLLTKYPFADEKTIIDLDISTELSAGDEKFEEKLKEKMTPYL